jgi:sugar-specific transcriptional regulator TrmB
VGEEKAVETLLKLGLTMLQAKVYLTLATSGPYTGRATANSTHISTNDVYRILHELQVKGLVEKIVNKPTMYKATQIEDGLAALLEDKKEEYIETKRQVRALSNAITEMRKQDGTLQCDPQLTITSEIKMLIKTHEKLANAAKQSIDFVLPVETKQELYDNPEYLNLAAKRNVKIREIIIGKGKNHTSNNPLFEVRTLPAIEQAIGMHIFDKQQVTLAMSEKATPSLWTNNAHIVKLSQVYFEELWNRAK